MRQLKATTLDDILSKAEEGAKLYNMLTPDERTEVDAFNAKLAGKSIREIIAAGTHPLVALRIKYLGSGGDD